MSLEEKNGTCTFPEKKSIFEYNTYTLIPYTFLQSTFKFKIVVFIKTIFELYLSKRKHLYLK